MAISRPGMSRNKWKSKMLIVTGAIKINAKASHFFSRSIMPTTISNAPTTGKMKAIPFNKFRNFDAGPAGFESGIKCQNMLLPKIISSNPNSLLIIVVNFEFIID